MDYGKKNGRYRVEYAASARSKCKQCKGLIDKKELRLVTNQQASGHAGINQSSYHKKCFFKKHRPTGSDQFTNFNNIRYPDQEELEEMISKARPMKTAKKRSAIVVPLSDGKETVVNHAELDLTETIKQQSKEFDDMRDALNHFNLDTLKNFLLFNSSGLPKGQEDLLDRCADFLTFGAIYKCQKCHRGDMIFSRYGYTCNAFADSYSKCNFMDQYPLRFFINKLTSLTDDEKEFFDQYQHRVKQRVVRTMPLQAVSQNSALMGHEKKLSPTSTNRMKRGVEIDPVSKLENIAHVYQNNGVIYSSTLSFAEVTTNKNSYYKLQVLEADIGNAFWFFTAWGRTGTRNGSSKTENCINADDACKKFENKFRDQTFNVFNSGIPFDKKPGKFNQVEIDFDDDDRIKKMASKSAIPSKLPIQTQKLVQMLFDEDSMKQMMMEFKLDLKKLPLGKLSQKQLQEASETLKEVEQLILLKQSSEKLVSLSNKFFTLIPHSFGLNKPPILDSIEMITKKQKVLDDLVGLEIAYSILQQETDGQLNPLDAHYNLLKTELKPLDRESDEFAVIQQYVENTHATTHSEYDLQVIEVFTVERNGEKARFDPYKKLDNRQLLWHGSGAMNFVSILTQGLKIAPPEAPRSGLMFGKGIYFADMVSKAANYCSTKLQNNVGLLLLSEVALGEMLELTEGRFISKLPDGKHSCKGVGKTSPDPQGSHYFHDGVEVPLGETIENENLESKLKYNEYIVYNEAQCKLRFLIKMKFDDAMQG